MDEMIKFGGIDVSLLAYYGIIFCIANGMISYGVECFLDNCKLNKMDVLEIISLIKIKVLETEY